MSELFSPCKIGPVTLRNRIIRSAVFEDMAYHNSPSDDLFNYHLAVAKGGGGNDHSGLCSGVAVRAIVQQPVVDA